MIGREVGATSSNGCIIQPIYVVVLLVVLLLCKTSDVGRRAVGKSSPTPGCALGLGTEAEFPLDGMRLCVLDCPCTEQFLGSMLKLEEISENGRRDDEDEICSQDTFVR